MQLDLPRNNYNLTHFGGRWAAERNAVTNKLVDGVQEVSSNLGATSAEESSFLYLADSGATYTHGEVLGFNLVYSGNFKFRTYSDMMKGTHITYGINDEDFAWVLADGESFVTPQAVVCYSADGIDGMSRNMHDFVRNHIVTYRHDREYKPVLFNCGRDATSHLPPTVYFPTLMTPRKSARNCLCLTTVGSDDATTTWTDLATGR